MSIATQLPSGAPNMAHGDIVRRFVDALAKLIDGLREGLAAMRAYDQYRARGASHADAITRAFDAGYNT